MTVTGKRFFVAAPGRLRSPIGAFSSFVAVLAVATACGTDFHGESAEGVPLAAPASRPVVEVRDVLGPRIPASERTRVMVLGSPHLAQESELRSDMLDGLIAALLDFGPDLIAIETQRSDDLAAMRALGDPQHESLVTAFAGPIVEAGAAVRDRLGVSRVEAVHRRNALLDAHREGGTRSEDERLDLAAYSLATYDFFTALLHWSYLDSETRTPSSLIPEQVAATLNFWIENENEITSVAIHLARELGHDRLHPVDDQFSNLIQSSAENQTLMADVEKAGLLAPLMAMYQEMVEEPLAKSIREGDLMPYYLHLNSPEYQKADLAGQWAVFLDDGVDPVQGRIRIARREVRDLQIATHIRRVTARYPGSRVLVLIGGSHKAFLESYLTALVDIELVQLSEYVSAGNAGGRNGG
jgi:hypothetical protein